MVLYLDPRPYRIGDRIKPAGASGDVISVGFFDTTLWEFGGEYVTTDHPSGRIIKFPNSLVLSTPEIEVTDDPLVLFRASDNSHIEAIVRYLVLPKQAGQIKTALIRKMLEKLNEQPKRVLFPTA